jgi:hypothetical protein
MSTAGRILTPILSVLLLGSVGSLCGPVAAQPATSSSQAGPGEGPEPGSAEAVRSEADRLYDTGRFTAALATYQKLLAAFPQYPERGYVETMVRTCNERLLHGPAEPPPASEPAPPPLPATGVAVADAAPAARFFLLGLETPAKRLFSVLDFELRKGELEISEAGFRWTDAEAPATSFFIPIDEVTRVSFHTPLQCDAHCPERNWLKVETSSSSRVFDDSSFAAR